MQHCEPCICNFCSYHLRLFVIEIVAKEGEGLHSGSSWRPAILGIQVMRKYADVCSHFRIEKMTAVGNRVSTISIV